MTTINAVIMAVVSVDAIKNEHPLYYRLGHYQYFLEQRVTVTNIDQISAPRNISRSMAVIRSCIYVLLAVVGN